MNLDNIFNVLGAIVSVAMVAVIVRPTSQSAKVIQAFGDAFSGAIRAASQS